MSKGIKLYTDEQVSNSIVNGLRLRGIDVVTTKQAGLLGATDEEHIAFAKNQNRVIFTQDDDFLRLHTKGMKHNGIVYAHHRIAIGDIIRGLILIQQVLSSDDMKNHVEFL